MCCSFIVQKAFRKRLIKWSNMHSFLKILNDAKKEVTSTSSTPLHIVLGNESCDLDSTISTLALSFLIHTKNQYSLNKNITVVPCLNVDEKYFHLRTETNYLLQECAIDPKSLTFKSDFDLATLIKARKVSVSLVDHHVLAENDKLLEKYVSDIFDHRPENTADICKNEKLRKHIRLVGSCSTLIANEIINFNRDILFKELNYLLYATIVYDTLGLNMDLGRTTEEDLNVAEILEELHEIPESRSDLFNTLWKVHLKVTQGIPIAGLPMLTRTYLQNDGIVETLHNFAKEYQTKIVVLLGIDASQQVQRDITIFFTDEKMKDILVETLKGTELELEEIPTTLSGIACFQQGNIKLTRKFILPLVNEAASKYC